jgi:hypothetical protein
MENIIEEEEFKELNLDFLYKDRVTSSYFKKYTDLIANRLRNDFIDQIKPYNITILLSFSPGAVISNFIFPINQKPTTGHIIIIDKHIIDYCGFNVEESAAAILHEFGHIFNNPVNQKEKEFYADYFAKKLGFGPSLASSLIKFLEKELPFITKENEEEIKQRIEALNNKNQSPLIGSSKNLTA